MRSGMLLVFTLILVRPVQSAFFPLPHGFVNSGTPKHYGSPEQKLADGSIFDYMDGGGIVYLDHGFQKLAHWEFSNFRNGLITMDRFTFDTSEQALAALADERIAPADGAPLPLQVTNKAYRFPPDYFVYLVWDRHLLYLHVNDDRLAETLDQFAVDVLKSLKEEKE